MTTDHADRNINELNQYDTAMVINHENLEALRAAYKEGVLTDETIEKFAKERYVEDEQQRAAAVAEIKNYCTMSRLEMEMDPKYKSDLSSVSTRTLSPDGKKGSEYTFEGVTLTRTGDGRDGMIHCKSDYLGEFDYDPRAWSVGYKEIQEDDGTISKLPVLEYHGSGVNGAAKLQCYNWFWPFDGVHNIANDNTGDQAFIGDCTVNVPNGVKNLDYTFANRSDLYYYPDVPNTVTSMHGTFINCTNMHFWGDFSGERHCILPHDLEDMSLTFKNCQTISGHICIAAKGDEKQVDDQLPYNLVNATETFYGCDNMDDKDIGWFGLVSREYGPPKFGMETKEDGTAVVYTPYLSSDLSMDIFGWISDNGNGKDLYKNAQNNTERTITGGKFNANFDSNDENLDDEKLGRIVGASKAIDAGGFYVKDEDGNYGGRAVTNNILSTNGHGTDNKIDITGKNDFINDTSGLKKTMMEVPENPGWQGVVMAVGTGAVAYGITGLFTDSKLARLGVGLGSVLLLKAIDVLPKSFYPIIQTTANLLPEGSAKTFMQNWADKYPEAIVERNKQIAAENAKWDDQYNVGEAQKDKRFAWIFNKATSNYDIVDSAILSDFMATNAKECVHEQTFAAVGMLGEDSASAVRDTIKMSTDELEKVWSESISKNGMTDGVAAEMREYYVSLMEGIEGYSKGAINGVNEYIVKDSALEAISLQGIKMTNRACTDELMSSLKEMEDKYHFMDDKSWDAIKKLDISGVDAKNLNKYDAHYFDTVRAETEKECEIIRKAFTEEREKGETVKMSSYGKKDSVNSKQDDEAAKSDTKTQDTSVNSNRAASVTVPVGNSSDDLAYGV